MNEKTITRLLLVEDNPGDARLLLEMFAEQGSGNTDLMHVESMSAAEKHLAERAVDIVVLDLGLPDVQGLDAVRRARAAAPRVPLVVLTGLDDETLSTQAIREGAQDYLVKGQIETHGLRRALRYAVERKDIEEALFVEKERAHRLNEELEERVVERTAELQAANRELETFSYSVSHDLRAPLRAINGFAAMLARRHGEVLDAQGRHYVETIVSTSEHMGVLIEELLDYARMGRALVRTEPVPLDPLVTRLRATFDQRIAESGATLEVIEPLVTPVGDPVLLERILVNLVENALNYRRPEVAPRVTLSATRHGRRVTLAVADNGIGIPAESHEKIFEVFARLQGDDTYKGTGIGLAIVRKAARLMGSDVTLESTEGEGSTFRLELPAARKGSTTP